MDPITSITAGFDPHLIAALPWVGIVSKMLVDYLRSSLTLPKWASPALSLVTSFILLVLSELAQNVPSTPMLLAQAVLTAIASAVLAIGATTLQARTAPSAETSARLALSKVVADELERRMKTERAAAPPPTGG